MALSFEIRAAVSCKHQTLYAGANGWSCRGRNPSGDAHLVTKDMTQRHTVITGEMVQLQEDVEELRKLVNTLLTIIMEEADGVQSGAAPTIPNQPRHGYCM
mgnify:CR=1 FL=1